MVATSLINSLKLKEKITVEYFVLVYFHSMVEAESDREKVEGECYFYLP
jgi:hypothetical protein